MHIMLRTEAWIKSAQQLMIKCILKINNIAKIQTLISSCNFALDSRRDVADEG